MEANLRYRLVARGRVHGDHPMLLGTADNAQRLTDVQSLCACGPGCVIVLESYVPEPAALVAARAWEPNQPLRPPAITCTVVDAPATVLARGGVGLTITLGTPGGTPVDGGEFVDRFLDRLADLVTPEQDDMGDDAQEDAQEDAQVREVVED